MPPFTRQAMPTIHTQWQAITVRESSGRPQDYFNDRLVAVIDHLEPTRPVVVADHQARP
jgi:hypothetical protein